MEQNNPTIEITRKNGVLNLVKIIMPTWNELGEDNKVYSKIPLLGGLTTYAMNESDADMAVREAIHCFCVASEKHGMGLEKEIQCIGWELFSKKEETSTFIIHSEVTVFELMMETGHTKAMELNMN